MSKKLDSFEFPRARRDSQNWDDWLDGSIWQLTRGEDFSGTVESVRARASREARMRGVKARTSVIDADNIVIEAYKAETP